MAEREIEGKFVYVECVCDQCGLGTMQADGEVLTSYPPQYGHSCTACGYSTVLDCRYPRMEFKKAEVIHEAT